MAGLHVLPLSLNDHPMTAQRSQGVVAGHPEIAIFQPTHHGLETASVLTLTPCLQWGADLGKLDTAPGTLFVG